MGHIMETIMQFSYWLELPVASACLFGEYPYPTEEDC